FMQASNTKNDVVVMLWVCSLIYWTFLLSDRSAFRWWRVALIGLAFGSLILTKGTGMIFGLPVAALLVVIMVRFYIKKAVPALLLIGVMALALNVGQFTRSYRTFGSIVPDKPGIHAAGPSVGNEDFSFGALASNLLRNTGPHFVLPNQAWN